MHTTHPQQLQASSDSHETIFLSSVDQHVYTQTMTTILDLYNGLQLTSMLKDLRP